MVILCCAAAAADAVVAVIIILGPSDATAAETLGNRRDAVDAERAPLANGGGGAPRS